MGINVTLKWLLNINCLYTRRKGRNNKITTFEPKYCYQPSKLRTDIFHVEIPFYRIIFLSRRNNQNLQYLNCCIRLSKINASLNIYYFQDLFSSRNKQKYQYSVKNNSKSVIFWFEEISENTILDNRTFKMRFCVSISCC